MKEVLYVQAGSFSNFAGTHFWNTQESYFTYEDDGDELQINHDVSFREGLTIKGDPTYSPRLLIFDRKAHFGSLSAASGLYEDDSESAPKEPWTGDVVQYRQEITPKSQYHSELEHEGPENGSKSEPAVIEDAGVRYWSDYSRVYYHPRSIHKLPDAADWESLDGNWTSGKETFSRYNQEASLMDDSVRLFAEECDSIQGLQLTNDTASFGSFADSFMTEFRDDFIKLPIITFFILSQPKTDTIDIDDSISIRKAVNDALCLRNLNELSTLNIPILPPHLWSSRTSIPSDPNSVFQSSAILSANVETATLPVRLKRDADDFPSLCARLNWRGDMRFVHLNGILPLPSPASFESPIDFSTIIESQKSLSYARWDVTRSFTPADISRYEDQWDASSRRTEFIYRTTHAFAYPIPSSFPSHLLTSPSITKPYEPRGIFSHSSPISMMSSLNTTSLSSTLFGGYATFIDKCVKRKTDTGTGVDIDELKELTNELWTIHDTFSDGGRDEDFYVDGGMAEDD